MEKINWHQVLSNPPPDRQTIEGYEQHQILGKAAGEWVTCACGNLCDAIPRNEQGAPDDFYLQRYGIQFSYAIDNQDWPKARVLLMQIETRSQFLLHEQAQKENQQASQTLPAGEA
jgi:hypothetical protein